MNESKAPTAIHEKHKPLDYERGYSGLYDSENSELLRGSEVSEIAKRIEVGLFAEQLRDNPDIHLDLPDNDSGAEKIMPDELDWLIQDGKEAMDKFVMANVGLVINIAKHYQGHETPFLDLVQEGMVGLTKAVQKFDYDKDFEFSTYAKDIIWQSIQQGVATNARLIYLPRNTYFDMLRVHKIKGRFLQETGRKATVQEIAERANKTEAEIERLLALPSDAVSLNSSDDAENTRTLGDRIVSDIDSEESWIDGITQAQIRDHVRELLWDLDERELKVITSDFGIRGAEKKRDVDIGNEYGVSRQAISLKRRKAMARLGLAASPALRELIA